MYLSTTPVATLVLPTQANYLLLYCTLIYFPSLAYRRKTTKSYELTRPVRTTTRKSKNIDEGNMAIYDDSNAEKDEDASTDADGEVDEKTDWFDDLKMDPKFAEENEIDLATGTPMDLETFSYSERWSPSEETTPTTEPTSTTLMDLSVIGFNKTWCTYIAKAPNRKLEGEAFVELVKKLCSDEHSEDNDVRLSLRHTLENRKLIDRLMDDIVTRLSADDEERRKTLLYSKSRAGQNEFCFNRVLKSFKYFCFDPDMNPYMQRHLKVMSNACRIPELSIEIIRDHIVEACESVNNNLVDVV